ncbi:MAG: hypothetical protein ACRD2C_22580 [Acidimicrobiales bacterium]
MREHEVVAAVDVELGARGAGGVVGGPAGQLPGQVSLAQVAKRVMLLFVISLATRAADRQHAKTIHLEDVMPQS